MDRRQFLKAAAIGAAGAGVLPAVAGPLHAAVLAPSTSDNAFRHPGLLHSEEELAFIKAQIKAGEKPWADEWKQLEDWCERMIRVAPEPRRKVVRGPSNNPDVGSTELLLNGSMAYSFALGWCLSGNKEYAKKAVTILDAWSAEFEELDGHDTKLLSGMAGAKFVNAAELIRHTYDGWKAREQDRFETMLRDVFYVPIKDFYPTANGNWDAAMIQTMLGMGIFLNDRKMFERAATYYRQGEGNGAITKYFSETGQCQESGRDQAHTQMGLGFLGVVCEMAWKQGVDLYGEADSRLALGFEYTAKYNLGHEVPYETYTSVEGRYKYKQISDDSRGRFAPIYERAVYHYHYRKGMEMPYTREAAAKPIRSRRMHQRTPHFRWTDLMFHRPPEKA